MKRVLMISGSPRPQGATQVVLSLLQTELEAAGNCCEIVRLSDCEIKYCLGCQVCYKTAQCVQRDAMDTLFAKMAQADVLVLASPSYWGDVTGQMKVFFDRCTPYCNTHTPHASLPSGKQGYAIALRTGSNAGECLHIIESIRHFYGHLNIACGNDNAVYLCGVAQANDISNEQSDQLRRFARSIA
ncbi:MAG: flavodoxin family protein [Oscillospiraceae bacterium]|nr:flavodoxin family protein [Oscillospiraceae bacterium]